MTIYFVVAVESCGSMERSIQPSGPSIRTMNLSDNTVDMLLDSSHGKPKLLVVDDQAINIQVMHQVFGGDYQVFMATSGAQALALCKTNPPDLVLLDITMPGDGLQATREIAATYPDRRVLILTVLESEDKLVAALQAGAAGYALKGMRGRESRPQSYLGSSALTPVRRWQIWRKHWPTTIRKFAIALPRRFPPWVSWQRLQFLR